MLSVVQLGVATKCSQGHASGGAKISSLFADFLKKPGAQSGAEKPESDQSDPVVSVAKTRDAQQISKTADSSTSENSKPRQLDKESRQSVPRELTALPLETLAVPAAPITIEVTPNLGLDGNVQAETTGEGMGPPRVRDGDAGKNPTASAGVIPMPLSFPIISPAISDVEIANPNGGDKKVGPAANSTAGQASDFAKPGLENGPAPGFVPVAAATVLPNFGAENAALVADPPSNLEPPIQPPPSSTTVPLDDLTKAPAILENQQSSPFATTTSVQSTKAQTPDVETTAPRATYSTTPQPARGISKPSFNVPKLIAVAGPELRTAGRDAFKAALHWHNPESRLAMNLDNPAKEIRGNDPPEFQRNVSGQGKIDSGASGSLSVPPPASPNLAPDANASADDVSTNPLNLHSAITISDTAPVGAPSTLHNTPEVEAQESGQQENGGIGVSRVQISESQPLDSSTVQIARMVKGVEQSEMHIGLRTQAFGNVDVHTVMRDSHLGLTVGSEKGNIRNFLSSEVGPLQSTLHQHELRFESIRYVESSDGTTSAFHGESREQPKSSHGENRSPVSNTPDCSFVEDCNEDDKDLTANTKLSVLA